MALASGLLFERPMTTERALGWLARHHRRFQLRSRRDIGGVKRLAELAYLAGAREDGGDWLRWAFAEVEEGQVIADLLDEAPALACAYLPFRRAGLRAKGLEHRLASASWRRAAPSWHWFVRLGVGETLDAVGIEPPWPPTWGRLPRDPAQATTVVAHAVIWRTDLGRVPERLSAAERAQLASSLQVMGEKLVEIGAFDALGELLVAAACADVTPPDGAWAALAAAQRADGSFPFRRGLDASFESSYHATLVAALAGSLASELPIARRRGRAQSAALQAIWVD